MAPAATHIPNPSNQSPLAELQPNPNQPRTRSGPPVRDRLNAPVTPSGTAEPLRHGEAYFRAITHHSSDIVFVLDREGTLTYANKAVERFLGYPPEELIGKSGFDLIVPADLPRAMHDFTVSIASTAGKVIPNAFRVRHRDGSERILEGVGTNLLEDPVVQGFVMNVRDVTDREASESARRESDQKFRDLAERSPVGIYIMQEGKLRYINAKFAEMHGYSIAEMIDKVSIKDIAHPDDWTLVEKKILDGIAGKAETFRGELRACRKSGEIIHLEVYGSITLYRGNPAVIGTVLDITERKRAEAVLKRGKAQLEELVAERTERTAELSAKNEQLLQEIRERKRAEAALRRKTRELQLHSAKLEEFNVALKVLLSKRDEDRTDLEDRVMSNLNHLVFPHFEALKNKIKDKESQIILEVLEGNLQKVTSSFSQKLSSKYMNLTPAEIKVANLVKEGKSIKEIAEMMAVSHFTIDIHRFHIRKKLGLKSRKINLQSYLQSLS